MPPFFENFGKRLIKSPKLYFVDPGLCCSLLGIESEEALKRSPFRGPLFEGFVVAEVVKQQVNQGREREVYYFRDQQGLEVDLIVPAGAGRLWVVEAKATGTPTPAAAAPLQRLAAAIENYQVVRALVFQPTRHPPPFGTLLPGVAAMSVQELLERLDGTARRSR